MAAVLNPIARGGVAPQTLFTGIHYQAGYSSATIAWTTNNPASGSVQYGLTSAYGQAGPPDSTFATSHSSASNTASNDVKRG